MGQKQFKNIQFPVKIRTDNQITVSTEPLIFEESFKKNIVYMVDQKLKPQKSFRNTNKVERLSFLTYNIWFQHNNVQNRIPCLLQLMNLSNADFICLQEVTSSFLKELLKQKWLGQKYSLSGFSMKGYECLILSKFPCIYYKFDYEATCMNRSLIVAETVINDKKFAIATSHFESLNSAHLRKQQLEAAFKILNTYQNAVLMGDFNFDSKWEQQEKNIDKKFIDLWLQLKQPDKNTEISKLSYTMPSTYRFPSWRPDRVLLKKSKTAQPQNIEIVGNFTIPPFQKDQYTQIQKDGIVRTPSDHFGLFATIKLMQQ